MLIKLSFSFAENNFDNCTGPAYSNGKQPPQSEYVYDPLENANYVL